MVGPIIIDTDGESGTLVKSILFGSNDVHKLYAGQFNNAVAKFSKIEYIKPPVRITNKWFDINDIKYPKVYIKIEIYPLHRDNKNPYNNGVSICIPPQSEPVKISFVASTNCGWIINKLKSNPLNEMKNIQANAIKAPHI